LTPYWLGEHFIVVDKAVEAGHAKFYAPPGPQVVVHYWVDGGTRVSITTYSNRDRGWQDYLNVAKTLPGISVTDSNVGSWPAKQWLLPLGRRPTNLVVYEIHIGETVLLATAASGSTGIPGTDLNPLIDPELWRKVLEEHLQPYPE